MVWGCVTEKGVGRLHRVVGNMDASQYVEILNKSLLGTLKDHRFKKSAVIFQQDGDPKHRSKMATEWFIKKKVKLLDWAPSSPDMNIIEHIWGYIE